jgi:hypothetical protein
MAKLLWKRKANSPDNNVSDTGVHTAGPPSLGASAQGQPDRERDDMHTLPCQSAKHPRSTLRHHKSEYHTLPCMATHLYPSSLGGEAKIG